MSKDHNDCYNDGYNRGKNSDAMDAFSRSISTGWGTSDSYDKSYNKGYEDGCADKYDDDNSNYSGGGDSSSSSSGVCFVTTACVKSKGLPDNCKELESLRSFRENFVLKLPEGNKLNEEYKRIAPMIVNHIDGLNNSKEIYDGVFEEIQKIVMDIDSENNEQALSGYLNLVFNLSEKFKIE